MVKTKEKVKEQLNVQLTDIYELVLYNDDVNTFDWVIESLIELCNHDEIQAEQCALIVHFKGKCAVKSGSIDQLIPIMNALNARTLSAKIE